MITKICKQCGKELPIDKFYRHTHSSDGHFSTCKECAIKNAIENRNKRLEYYRAYDRKMNSSPKRVKARNDYDKRTRSTPEGLAMRVRAAERYNKIHPDRYKAHYTFLGAIKTKRIIRPEVCSVCEKKTKVQGHHPDYSKPLEIVWVCRKCHMKIHKDLNEIERKK